MRRTVRDVMTADVVVAAPSTPYKELVRLMQAHHVNALPVIDDRSLLVGVVSDTDLLVKERYPHRNGQPGPLDWLRQRATLRKADATTAAELMTAPAVTITPTATLTMAARVAGEAHVKHLPVVAGGALVGIVSRSDLLKVYLRSDAEIRREIAAEVEEARRDDPSAEPGAVTVWVSRGVVRLHGQLERHSQVDMLVRRVELVDGVVRVERDLRWRDDDLRPPLPSIPLGF